MPRSVRDSEEEIDIKPGRKSRLTDAISTDSPLRRSSRIKSVKQNESSPESISSDISSVSNTQTRVTRRRTGGIDNTTTTEKQRTLRSRIRSTSLDVNESAEFDIVITNTPTKRRSTIINDVLSKTDNRRSKRFTRAGSESKSPPTRIKRNTRSVSLEPEKEENRKILVVALDRTLPSVDETKEMDVNGSSKSLSNIEGNLNADCHNTTEKCAENNDSENLSSKPEDNEKNTSTDDKNMPANNKNMSKEERESLCIHAVSQIESSIHNLSQSFSQKPDQNSSKELGLKIENLLSTSMEKHEDFSNKENLTANIIGDESNIENAGSSTPLQSPKPLSISNPNTLLKEICKSPGNLSLRSRHSRSSESVDDAIVSEKKVNTDNVADNSVVDSMNVLISADDTDVSDNMPKLAVDTDSLSEPVFNINSNRSVTLKICSDSSSDGSIEFVKCMEDIKTVDDNDKLIDTDTILNKETGKVYNEVTMDTVVSKVMNDKDDVMKAVTESCILENTQNNNNDNCTSTRSSLNSTNVIPLTSLDKISTTSTESSTFSKNKSASEFEGINKVNISDSNTDSILESLNAHKSPKNVASINTDKDCIINAFESNLSSTTIETQVKLTEGMSEKEEVFKNDCLTSKNRPTEKLELDKQKFESMQRTSNESQEDVNRDDNDSNKNAVNLFQDISADEWKEKNTDIDKNSIHSMSTDRLDNETEAECDLVLVDKETWLSVENMETVKEKRAFDYDSDDTFLLKKQRDNVKEQKNEQIDMDMLGNDSKMKVNKDPTTNKNNIDNENVMENTEDRKRETQNEDLKNVSLNTSIIKEQNKHCLFEQNISNRQLVKENYSLELDKNTEIKDISLLNKNNLSEDVPEKQKSINKSICETDNKLERSNKGESVKNRKSLNKSNYKEKETATADSNSENTVISSVKKLKEKRSLNSSLKKQINDIEESDNEFKKSNICKKENSATKTMVRRNCSTVTSIESDSDNSQNKVMMLPKFLFAEVSNTDSNDASESDSSINSDIEKEYNLHGKDVSEFSDDDVPGDECRASETESSDPDDNGSDLADFVIDDDVVEKEIKEKEKEEGEEEDSEEEYSEEEDSEEIENENVEKNQEEEIKKQEEIMQGPNKLEKNIEEGIIMDNKNEQQNNEVIVDTSVDIADNKQKKLNDSKKTKLKKKNTSQLNWAEYGQEQEYGSFDLSLSNSIKLKKGKQKRVSNEFIVEDIEQPLNDSQLMFNKKLQKQLSKSMNCSTPKSHLLKSEEFDVSITSLNASDSKINACCSKETNKDIMLKTKNSFKKLKNLQNKKNVDSCLPSELAELVEKTNFSKPSFSKVAELNMTTSVPDSETPTTKYLKKEKLHESVPVLKLDTKFKKSINVNDDSEQNNALNQVKKENEVVKTSDVEIAEELNNSLKGKLLKVANNILNVDRQKKHKRQKQTKNKNNRDTLIASSLHENIDSQIKNGNEYSVSINNTDRNKEFEETVSNEEKKKKKKKKQKITHTNVNQVSNKELIDSKLEVTKKSIPKKEKKKQKKEIIENISDVYSEKELPGKKSNKISRILPNEEITATQISKKKQKLSSTDITLPSNEIVIEKLPKKRKKLVPEDVSLKYEGIPHTKLSKKIQNLSPDDFSRSENISTKKLSKRKDKLLLENDGKNKVKSTKTPKKSQQSKNIMSNSDEGPIKFSEARDEALTVIKRTADKMKTNKEMGKKKRKEHADEIRKKGELKNKSQKLNKQEINTNKTELQRKGIKRLSDEVLENLSDVPLKPLKKRKLSKTEEQTLLSRTMFDEEVKDTYLEDFVQPSSSGSTTQFTVVNIQKIKKKKVSSVISFKQKMLARNSRQPVSAYLMYLAKQKTVDKDKFYNKPY